MKLSKKEDLQPLSYLFVPISSSCLQADFKLSSSYVQVVCKLYASYLQVVGTLSVRCLPVVCKLSASCPQIVFKVSSCCRQVVFKVSTLQLHTPNLARVHVDNPSALIFFKFRRVLLRLLLLHRSNTRITPAFEELRQRKACSHQKITSPPRCFLST